MKNINYQHKTFVMRNMPRYPKRGCHNQRGFHIWGKYGNVINLGLCKLVNCIVVARCFMNYLWRVPITPMYAKNLFPRRCTQIITLFNYLFEPFINCCIVSRVPHNCRLHLCIHSFIIISRLTVTNPEFQNFWGQGGSSIPPLSDALRLPILSF